MPRKPFGGRHIFFNPKIAFGALSAGDAKSTCEGLPMSLAAM
jgi:hypothetical protein